MNRIDRTIALADIRPNPRNARTHSRRQIKAIADSIRMFGFMAPVIVDEEMVLIAGHGRVEAAKLLGMAEIPAIEVHGLSPAKRRALMLADNKLAERAGWDREKLVIELKELEVILAEEEIDIGITGFEVAEIDQMRVDFSDRADPADDVPRPDQRTISKAGDLWLLGRHRLLCGDARSDADIDRLMDGGKAAMAITDPPFNVRVRGIVGRGHIKHEEFAMASGEMSREEFTAFLADSLQAIARVLRDGALAFAFMDWRHMEELIAAGGVAFDEMVNLCVWVKSNAGQGSFYRSQHELIGVFRSGSAPHMNNVELGRHGRSRSNVWHHAGVNTFRKGRLEDLAAHPTVKPVAMIADAIKDCTRRGDIVLDTFCGAGTTILAAERVGRRGYGVEIEPRFVDVAIRRWQTYTGKDAVNATSGLVFDEAASERMPARPPDHPPSLPSVGEAVR